MKKLVRVLFIFCSLTLFLTLAFTQAPHKITERTQLDLRLWPFCHGVASGDPLSDRVIIWTRVTPLHNPAPSTVNWTMASDTGMTNVVANGTANTDATKDWTVKVDVTGLTPNSWYYYRFDQNGRESLTGRTRTAPQGDVDSLRFAVVSCSDYVDGYFHGFKKIIERNDVDAVIHLGDYIYENGATGSIGRPHEPLERINELDDYRQRYSQYRLDDDMRCIHQMYPFINTWDDHEIANNSWKGGAEAHDAGDGIYALRKRMAAQAYYEWIPIRQPDLADTIRVYREMQWGDLAHILMMDSRHIERDSVVTAGSAAIDDTSRQMLGKAQLGWLSNEMRTTSAQWKILGQQVMMAPLELPLIGPLWNDAWDGYRAERNRLYDTVLTHNIEDVVVLTGDIHTAWANNLEKGNDKVGVEFICSSITTMNSPIPVSTSIMQLANPHVQYVELTGHGYYILDINKDRVQADYYFVGDITNPNDLSQTTGEFWYVNDGEAFLRKSSNEAPTRAGMEVLQPSKLPPNILRIDPDDKALTSIVLGTYPNPFWDKFLVKLYLGEAAEVAYTIVDSKGMKISEESAEQYSKGLHYLELEGAELSSGVYFLQIKIGTEIFNRSVVRF